MAHGSASLAVVTDLTLTGRFRRAAGHPRPSVIKLGLPNTEVRARGPDPPAPSPCPVRGRARAQPRRRGVAPRRCSACARPLTRPVVHHVWANGSAVLVVADDDPLLAEVGPTTSPSTAAEAFAARAGGRGHQRDAGAGRPGAGVAARAGARAAVGDRGALPAGARDGPPVGGAGGRRASRPGAARRRPRPDRPAAAARLDRRRRTATARPRSRPSSWRPRGPTRSAASRRPGSPIWRTSTPRCSARWPATCRPALRDARARPLGVDRCGFRLRVETAEGDHDVRLAWGREVTTPADLCVALTDKMSGAPRPMITVCEVREVRRRT